MPDEPLIFVEIALSKEIPTAIQTILADHNEQMMADQKQQHSIQFQIARLALRISFGNSLIKTVVSELRREFESLEKFVTSHLCQYLQTGCQSRL